MSELRALDEDALFEVAVAEVGQVVAALAASRVRLLVADELARQHEARLLAVAGDQPSAEAFMHRALAALEVLASQGGTAAGAHDVVRRLARSMGIQGSTSVPYFRRTRAEVDANPNPNRPREGAMRGATGAPAFRAAGGSGGGGTPPERRRGRR